MNKLFKHFVKKFTNSIEVPPFQYYNNRRNKPVSEELERRRK